MSGDTPDGGACGPFPPWPDGVSPLTFDPAWRTETVRGLASGITVDRAYDRMPILADALEEAGCDNLPLLNHCRLCARHLTSCWALGLIIDHPVVPPPEPAPLPRPTAPIPTPTPAGRGEGDLGWMKWWGLWVAGSVAGGVGLAILNPPTTPTGPGLWSAPDKPAPFKFPIPPEDPDRPGGPPDYREAAPFDGFHAALAELRRGPYAGWRGFGRDHFLPSRHRFGFSLSRHAGGADPGEVGGVFWRHPSPVYFAVPVPPLDLSAPLSASGRLSVRVAGPGCRVCVGWFRSESLRLAAELGAHPVFAESVRRNILGFRIARDDFLPVTVSPDAAGGRGGSADGAPSLKPRPPGPYRWELRYDPGLGRVTLRLDDEEVTWELPEPVRAEGATFDRFGLFAWEPPPLGTRAEVYLDDVRHTGQK